MSYTRDTYRHLRSLYEARCEPEGLRVLAELYWRTLLFVAMLCIGGTIAFGLWQFVAVLERLSTAQRPEELPPIALNRAELQSTIQEYMTRESRYQETITHPISIGDPSR